MARAATSGRKGKAEKKDKTEKAPRSKKDSNAPKRNLSAYFLWLKENRAELTKPGMSVTEVSKVAGVEWNKVTDRSKWEAAAAEDKKRYEREMAAYRAGGDAAGTSN